MVSRRLWNQCPPDYYAPQADLRAHGGRASFPLAQALISPYHLRFSSRYRAGVSRARGMVCSGASLCTRVVTCPDGYRWIVVIRRNFFLLARGYDDFNLLRLTWRRSYDAALLNAPRRLALLECNSSVTINHITGITSCPLTR